MSKDVYQEDPREDDDVISLDADLENSDWTKTTWDLPPYKSREFLEAINGDLAAFRKLPVYKAAVDQHLIHDDEWVADHVRKIIPKE